MSKSAAQRIVDAYHAHPDETTSALARRANASPEYVRKVLYRAQLPVPGTYDAGVADTIRRARASCHYCAEGRQPCYCGLSNIKGVTPP